MPLAVIIIVLVCVATLILYLSPAVKNRLGNYEQARTVDKAFAAADAITRGDRQPLQSKLKLAARSGGGQVLVVDRQGKVTASAGRKILSPVPQRVLRAASKGERRNEKLGDNRVAVVPMVRNGNMEGGIVFISGNEEVSVYNLFLRSGIEAAALASAIGIVLALLMATFLGRRVSRFTRGVEEVEQGNYSYRLDPSFKDELGQLAVSFNSMAGKLQDSFSQLEERSATLKAIVNNLNEGVMATNLEGDIMFANPIARTLLNLGAEVDDEEDYIKVPDLWEDVDLPGAVDRCAKHQECLEARVNEGENFLEINVEHLPKFDDHKGGVLVVIRDLSEGRRLEANQQRFLANAAHELKTPITTILGSAEILLTEEDDDPEIRQRFLRHISTEAYRMQRLSDTLLRLARTGSRREPNIESVDLEGLARETVGRMEPLANAAGLRLCVEGDGGYVAADRERLEQCILILLSNAIQHSEQEGDLLVKLDGTELTIRDEGQGINEADLPHVFERFYRGRGSSSGFGLGLPICKELVENMDGSINIHSKEGAGTSVKIELPGFDKIQQST